MRKCVRQSRFRAGVMGGTMVLEWLLLASIPAIGVLILVFVMNQWGRKHDPMGGHPGHIWEPDDVQRGPDSD